MKRILSIASMGLIVSGLMFAQGRMGPRADGTAPDPAARIANQVKRLTTLLDLTSSQATQVTTILTNEQSAISPLQTNLQTNQTSLKSAIETNTTSTIDQLSLAIGSLNGQILALRSKSQAGIYALLTATQKAKIAEVGGIGALGGGPGGRGPGGPGGPRGRQSQFRRLPAHPGANSLTRSGHGPTYTSAD